MLIEVLLLAIHTVSKSLMCIKSFNSLKHWYIYPILAILAGRSDPVSYEVTDFFPLVPGVPKTLCVPSKVEFLFSPVLWNSCD